MESALFQAVTLLKLAVAGFVAIFWLRMFFECVVEEPRGSQRTLWTVAICFGNIFGAVAYYFMRHRPCADLRR
jgi:H+/Cl- antiporter ClcA